MSVRALTSLEMQVSMLIANEISLLMNHFVIIVLSATHMFSLPTPKMKRPMRARMKELDATEAEKSICPATKIRVKPSMNMRTPALSTRIPRNTDINILEKLYDEYRYPYFSGVILNFC
jgi:hypothetical protein